MIANNLKKDNLSKFSSTQPLPEVKTIFKNKPTLKVSEGRFCRF